MSDGLTATHPQFTQRAASCVAASAGTGPTSSASRVR